MSLTLKWEGADLKGTQWVRLRESRGCGKPWLHTQTLGSSLEGRMTLGNSLNPSKPQPYSFLKWR